MKSTLLTDARSLLNGVPRKDEIDARMVLACLVQPRESRRGETVRGYVQHLIVMEGSLTKAPVLQLHFMDSDGFGAPTFWGGRDQIYTTHGPDINCVDGPRVLGAAEGGDGSKTRPAPGNRTTLLVPTRRPWHQVTAIPRR